MPNSSSTPRASRKLLSLAIASALFIALPAQAQEKPTVQPSKVGQWQVAKARDGVERLITPGIDRMKAEAADVKRFDSGEVPHYAVALKYDVDPSVIGTWDEAEAGVSRWRLRIASPGANSINLGFSKFEMPEGGELRLIDDKGNQPYRAFTAADNDEHGQLWTPLVVGSELMLEVRVPDKARDALRLELSSINHGYRLPGEQPTYFKSGSCNVDVVCPEGDDWRDQIQASAVISTGGVTFCSGSLVNNTANDKKGYFMTAAHCNINAGNAASLVTYWNFQNSTCRTPGSAASGQPGNGTLNQFNTGSFFRAAYSPSDFTLVELDDPIAQAVNPFYAGWNRGTANLTSAVSIHHPDTDEKRITFENQVVEPSTYLGTATPGDGTHWWIKDWDLGTTEPGSSGSPLYDQDKRFVGQLHGGTAACGNNDPDYYGRMSVSWTGGGTNATRLSNWLDPTASGAMVIDGIGPSPFLVTTSPISLGVCNTASQVVINVDVARLEPTFANPVALSVNGAPANVSTSFANPSVTPPGTTALTLGNLGQAAPGNYTLQVIGTEGTNTSQANVPLTVNSTAPGVPVTLLPSNGGSASTSLTLTWQASSQAAEYDVQLDDNADFSSPIVNTTVTGTSLPVTGLSASTTYYWRVTADNNCATSAPSATSSFTTGAEYCFTPNPASPIPDNAPTAGLVSTLNIPAGATTIGDLDVDLDITHTWIGDLIISLVHVDTGTSVLMMDRPGGTGTSTGCNGNDPDVIVDDEATNTLETNCVAGANPALGYVDGARYRPNSPLSAFDGQPLAGTWELRITDNAAADTGTLNAWCLLPTSAPSQTVDAVNDTYAATEDTPLSVPAPGVLGNDTASGGTPTATVLAQATNGTVVVAANGGFTYTPTANTCGADSFTYTATNGPVTDTATVTLNVACQNDAPVFTAEPYAFTVEDGAANGTAVGSVGSTDVDGPAPVYSITGGNTGGAFAVNSATGAITVANSAAVTGASFTLTLQVSDGTATDTTTVTITVTGGNVAPVAGTLDDVTAPVESPVSILTAGAFTDADGDTLTYSATGLPPSMSINPATGEITGTPTTAQAGDYAIEVTATDPSNASAEADFTLTVALLPLFANGFE